MTTTRIYPLIQSTPTVGGATAANQVIEIAALDSIDLKTPPLGQDVKANSVPVVLASDQDTITIALPTGASTEAKQDVGNSSLSSIDTKTPSLGQALMAASAPVVIASDQSSLVVDLPTDAATETKQDVGNSSLSSIDTKTPSLGQAVMASSVPVVLASDQSIIDVNPQTLTVVDQIDTTPLLDVSSSNIPASSSNSLQIVASLAADVKKVISVEDIGEFTGLYSGIVSAPTLLCVLPLGGGEMDITIPAGTIISIRNMKNATITSGFIAINFLG